MFNAKVSNFILSYSNGCLGLLAEAARRELISAEEAKQDAKRLIDEGYRVSEEVLKEFYTMLGSKESK
jgi:predicted nucleic acid-binding protein